MTIVLGLVARTFGSYAKALLSPDGPELWVTMFGSAIVVFPTAVNALGSEAVGKAEELIVMVKVAVLALFVVAGLGGGIGELTLPPN